VRTGAGAWARWAARRITDGASSDTPGKVVVAGGAWLAVMAGAAATALELSVSGTVPLATVLPAMLGVHALIGVGEAVITVAAVSAVMTTRPDLAYAR
jgi:cobalt/nickel transport system permease protein